MRYYEKLSSGFHRGLNIETKRFIYKMRLLLRICLILAVFAPIAYSDANKVQILKTTNGVRFGIWGPKSKRPAPTLFILSTTIEDSLKNPQYLQCGTALAERGYLCVSLDLPCHGLQQRDGEPQELEGWRYRVEHNEPFISDFVTTLTEVLDYLISQGYTDPDKVAVCGTSRGGFIALHFAAREPRVKCVAAFIPVVDLGKLREFEGCKDNPLVTETALTCYAEKFSGKPVYLIIGDQDNRVDTDSVIKFARKVSQVSGKKTNIEIHVMPKPGHSIPDGAAESSAIWVAKKIKSIK